MNHYLPDTHGLTLTLPDEAATIRVGETLAAAIKGHELITLSGDLGTGKTTLCRGLIRALGHDGSVKSPTFTLVEPYELERFNLYHFDLYRLSDPEELEFIGIRDYLNGTAVCLIEWPEKATPILPEPDLAITLKHDNLQRIMQATAQTPAGENLLKLLDSFTS